MLMKRYHLLLDNQHFRLNYHKFALVALVVLCWCGSISVVAQNPDKLERERKTILKRIKDTRRILERTRRDKSSVVKRVQTIRQRIRQQERLLTVLQEEVKTLAQNLKESEQIVTALERDLKALKTEYARMVYTSFKYHNEYEQLAYLFAAESVQQMLARLQYIREYRQIRSDQIERIRAVKGRLEERRTDLVQQSREKAQLLRSIREERESLIQLRRRQQNLAKEMREKEVEVLRDLKTEQRVLKEVENLISQQIQSSSFSASLSENEKIISASFAKNKGRLIWPTRDGFISAHFGLHTYMTSGKGKYKKDIKVQKLGVDIQTNPNATVRAVFPGVVADVSQIPGRGYLIMVQHGDYFTVYAKLKDVQVKVGDTVEARQALATVITNAENVAEVEFQVWRHLEKLNPEDWLAQ